MTIKSEVRNFEHYNLFQPIKNNNKKSGAENLECTIYSY